jgi:hypothetical protein
MHDLKAGHPAQKKIAASSDKCITINLFAKKAGPPWDQLFLLLESNSCSLILMRIPQKVAIFYDSHLLPS